MRQEQLLPERNFAVAYQQITEVIPKIPESIRPRIIPIHPFYTQTAMKGYYRTRLIQVGFEPQDAELIASTKSLEESGRLFYLNEPEIAIQMMQSNTPQETRLVIAHELGHLLGAPPEEIKFEDVVRMFGDGTKEAIVEHLRYQPYMFQGFLLTEKGKPALEAMQEIFKKISTPRSPQPPFVTLLNMLENPQKRLAFMDAFYVDEEGFRRYIQNIVMKLEFYISHENTLDIIEPTNPIDQKPRNQGTMFTETATIINEAVAEAYACYVEYLYFCMSNRLPVNKTSLKTYIQSKAFKQTITPDNTMFPQVMEAALAVGRFDRFIQFLGSSVDPKISPIVLSTKEEKSAIESYMYACAASDEYQRIMRIFISKRIPETLSEGYSPSPRFMNASNMSLARFELLEYIFTQALKPENISWIEPIISAYEVNTENICLPKQDDSELCQMASKMQRIWKAKNPEEKIKGILSMIRNAKAKRGNN